MKSTSSYDELVLMLLNKKRKKWRFWFHPNLKVKATAGIISWFDPGAEAVSRSLSYWLRRSVGQFELVLANLGPH